MIWYQSLQLAHRFFIEELDVEETNSRNTIADFSNSSIFLPTQKL